MRWILYASLALTAFMPVAARAMNLSPSSADMVLMPGEQGEIAFVVENTSSVAHTYAVSAYDVAFPTETGEPQFGPISSAHSGWISFDTYDFSLAPMASRTVTLAVTVPIGAEMDTLVFAPVIRESVAGGGVTLATGVSSLLFVTVGNPSTEAVIESFSAPHVSAHLPVQFAVTIANKGNRVVQPYGIVRLVDVFGREVVSLDFNDTFRRVPSGVSREFLLQWGISHEESGGIFQELWRELTAGVGLFTAELVAAPYPGAELTLHATTRIVVFPWRIAAIVCSVGLLGSYIIARKRRRF